VRWAIAVLATGIWMVAAAEGAMRRLADGYPDPKTGVNTAISSAVTVKFAQVFARHPPEANTIVTKN
jgi:hypothetical protein